MKQSLSEAVKKAAANPDRASLHPDALIFHRIRIDESTIPVVLNSTGPNAYACGQDRRRQRRERERRRNR